MKLRVRSLESKETLRIEVPDDSSLHQLKETIAQTIQSSSSSLRLSLNRKDELIASSLHNSLQSLGIATGDLIFYSIVPDSSSSSKTLVSNSESSKEPQVNQQTLGGPISTNQHTLVSNQSDILAKQSNTSDLVREERNFLRTGEGSNLQVEEGEEGFGADTMEIDDELVHFEGSKVPESCFVRRISKQGLGEDGRDHKLMVIAVDSVLLESGFVGYDSVSGTQVDIFRLLDNWQPSMAFTLSFQYTLPEILSNKVTSLNASFNVMETIVVKFQIIGRFVNVFASLTNGGSGTYRVCLDEHKFVPNSDSLSPNDESERQVYGLWKIVKDGLALPLLIDLCAKAGLPSPPCFMRLPSELQMKILEFLPGTEIAKMGCVCKELQYLSCNNDLWKRKFEEEFGGEAGSRAFFYWKKSFATYWQGKKQRREAAEARQRQFPRYGWPLYNPIRRNPFELSPIGGDYDRLPALVPPPFGRPGRLPLFRRTFSPNCNLGGFSG